MSPPPIETMEDPDFEDNEAAEVEDDEEDDDAYASPSPPVRSDV